MIHVDTTSYSRFIPGSVSDFHLYHPGIGMCMLGLQFVRASGSNLVALHAAGEDADRRVCMLAEVINLAGHRLHVRTISRLAAMGSFEIHPSGHMAGRFELVTDTPLDDEETDRCVRSLCQITQELQRQWLLIGDAGKSRIISKLSEISPSLLGSTERNYLNCRSDDEVRSLLSSYRSFEKLSFLLIVVSVANARARELMISGRDTVRRLDAVLAVLRKPGTLISIDAGNGVRGGDLLRFNTGLSAIALLLILIIVLVLKGSGVLNFSHSSLRY